MLTHSLNIDSQSFVLPDFVSFWRSFVDRNQKVLNFLIVNFHHGYIDFVFLVGLVRVLSYPVENLLASYGHNSFVGSVSHH